MLPLSPGSSDHPNSAAHRWLAEKLVRGRRPRLLSTAEAIELVESQPIPFQVAILKACVEQLPQLRQRWSEQGIYQIGEQFYAIACTLYARALPLDESDICDILCTSKHGCGHGGDVVAPVDLAVSFISNYGLSPKLLAALSIYVDGLKGVGSCAAHDIKSRVSILSLLDDTDTLVRKHCDAWSRRFTEDLAHMADWERRAWQSLLLTFKLSYQSALPNTWRKVARAFAARLGEAHVVSRIADWWPEAGSLCRLDTGGSHLLKHFVWLAGAIDNESPVKQTCHELVCALSTVHWKPEPPAAKVVCAAAYYLVALPQEVAWEPLQRLCATASSRAERVRKLTAQYAATHGLVLEASPPADADASSASPGGNIDTHMASGGKTP